MSQSKGTELTAANCNSTLWNDIIGFKPGSVGHIDDDRLADVANQLKIRLIRHGNRFAVNDCAGMGKGCIFMPISSDPEWKCFVDEEGKLQYELGLENYHQVEDWYYDPVEIERKLATGLGFPAVTILEGKPIQAVGGRWDYV